MIGDTVKTAYSGYANNKAASEKKIIYDVFKKGQKAFNSGLKIVLFCFFTKKLQQLKIIFIALSLQLIHFYTREN
jgi:hypothetical protein